MTSLYTATILLAAPHIAHHRSDHLCEKSNTVTAESKDHKVMNTSSDNPEAPIARRSDKAKAERVMNAMMKMTKIFIAALKEAAAGVTEG